MRKYRHTRILPIPNRDSIPGGWLEDLRLDHTGGRKDLVIDYSGLRHLAPPELLERDGIPVEHIRGEYFPCRLRFGGVSRLVQSGLYRKVSAIPAGDAARSIRGFFYWRTTDGVVECLLLNGSDEPAELRFSAESCAAEERQPLPARPVDIVRDWSPAPLLPPRLVPDPTSLHQRFGGDPVGVIIEGKKHLRRLFIGGIEIQPRSRPEVTAVLNLAEDPSRWVKGSLCPSDRWVEKGEGRRGMSLDDITAEAGWVIERLRAGESVLVHCVAGMNRSATVVCAVLVLLEGLSAEEALSRVREHHPWARPDSHHWLILRWLAKK